MSSWVCRERIAAGLIQPMVGDGGAGPDFKICGLTNAGDAAAAAAAGASYVGAILVPGSPRLTSAEGARAIAQAVDIPLAIVVANLAAEDVIRAARTAGASVIQLHGDEDLALIHALRAAGPWEIWKVVRPRAAEELVAAGARFGGEVDLLLVDAWHPERLGGTGSRADWSEIAGVRDRLPGSMRFGLAGGLDPGNVAEAIEVVGPDLVDVSSGVEATPGRKDPERVEAFARGVRGDGPDSGKKKRDDEDGGE